MRRWRLRRLRRYDASTRRAAPKWGVARSEAHMLTLYYAPGACSMAAHIVLEESGEKYEPRKVDLAGGEQRTEAYMKLNPQGRGAGLGLGRRAPPRPHPSR